MESITHILNFIEKFSSQTFIFSTYLDSLKLLNESSLDSLNGVLNDIDVIHHINEAASHIDWLTKHFENKVNPAIKKLLAKTHPKKDKEIPYADFKVDKQPIFKNEEEKPKQISFETILQSKEIKPIKRRDDSFSYDGVCPHCSAPNEYIYSNNNRGQYKCKACCNTFTLKKSISDTVGIYCPYCRNKLQQHHDRKGYIVYRCENYKCEYYLKNKENPEKTSSKQDYLHYHYRDFKFNLESLKEQCNNANTKVNLSKIQFDENVLGLALTYYVNFGLSTRKTALILKQVHGVRISHQTIKNYAEAVSKVIEDMVSYYSYDLSSTLTGDETYIKVGGKNHYVFFWSDTAKKIITSHKIYPTRDTECACRSIMDCLQHYNGNIPEDLTLITDGNPIYNASQLFYKMNDINFDLYQVIGVKNKDDTSTKYRPYKQVEERLNRTYKQNYHGTNGYHNLDGANSYMTLFVAYHNFLRQHSSLNYKTPVEDDRINKDDLMYTQWLQLIAMSNSYHLQA